jgi:hypothetical protein
MLKTKIDNGVLLEISLRELAEEYNKADRNFICIVIMQLCSELIRPYDMDVRYITEQFGTQWVTKVLGEGTDSSSLWGIEHQDFKMFNSESEYSFDMFKETLGSYIVEYDYEIEYRQWVFGKVLDKFGEVMFEIKICDIG